MSDIPVPMVATARVLDYWTKCDAHPEADYEDCSKCRAELDSILEDALRGRRILARIRRLTHRQRLDLDTMLLLAGISRK